MGRYIDAKCRICRRNEVKLFLKGEKCIGPKCTLNKKKYAPGQRGRLSRKISEYALQLKAKQKLRFLYSLMERQFRNYYEKAARSKGNTAQTLIQMLESRLDNVVYRMNFAASRAQARQLITHGHILVHGQKVSSPSYSLRPGEFVEVITKSKMKRVVRESLKIGSQKSSFPWLSVNVDQVQGTFLRRPERSEIHDVPPEEQLIVEHYSR